VTPLITVEVTNALRGSRSITVAGADGSFSVNVLGEQGDTVSVVTIDEAENRSPASNITVLAVASPFARVIRPGVGFTLASLSKGQLFHPSGDGPAPNRFFPNVNAALISSRWHGNWVDFASGFGR